MWQKWRIASQMCSRYLWLFLVHFKQYANLCQLDISSVISYLYPLLFLSYLWPFDRESRWSELEALHSMQPYFSKHSWQTSCPWYTLLPWACGFYSTIGLDLTCIHLVPNFLQLSVLSLIWHSHWPSEPSYCDLLWQVAHDCCKFLQSQSYLSPNHFRVYSVDCSTPHNIPSQVVWAFLTYSQQKKVYHWQHVQQGCCNVCPGILHLEHG